jgi:hypothetical protein
MNDDGGSDAGPPSTSSTPTACDGALCDTTNGAETGGSCSVTSPGGPVEAGPLFGVIGALVLAAARKAKRKARRDDRAMERQ